MEEAHSARRAFQAFYSGIHCVSRCPAGVRGVWAVRFRPEGLPWEPDFAYHAFLLLTVGRKTKVLQTGEELSEMRSSQVRAMLPNPSPMPAMTGHFPW